MRSSPVKSHCYATEAMILKQALGSDLLCGNQTYTIELPVLATN